LYRARAYALNLSCTLAIRACSRPCPRPVSISGRVRCYRSTRDLRSVASRDPSRYGEVHAGFSNVAMSRRCVPAHAHPKCAQSCGACVGGLKVQLVSGSGARARKHVRLCARRCRSEARLGFVAVVAQYHSLSPQSVCIGHPCLAPQLPEFSASAGIRSLTGASLFRCGSGGVRSHNVPQPVRHRRHDLVAAGAHPPGTRPPAHGPASALHPPPARRLAPLLRSSGVGVGVRDCCPTASPGARNGRLTLLRCPVPFRLSMRWRQ
jgi:hypothetical protein